MPEVAGFEYRWLRALVGMALVTATIAIALGVSVGVPALQVLARYAGRIWWLSAPTLFLALVIFFVRSMVLRRPSPFEDLRPFVASRLGSVEAAAATLGPILIVPVILGAFGTLKQIMPLISPFAWDNGIAEVGRVMFGGTRAWHFTHAIFGGPLPTMIIDRVYTAWVPILSIAVLFFAVFAAPELRARFFLSFAAAWVLLGIVGAFLLSSAGPCFVPHLGGPAAEDFGELMARLRSIDAAGYHLGALEWQEMLWKAQAEHRYGFGLGISAMPSMHNAIAFLYGLAALRTRPLVRAVVWLFAVTILIGSVHLGWHYIADGIVAWAGMGLIWWGAGVYLNAGATRSEEVPELVPAAA